MKKTHFFLSLSLLLVFCACSNKQEYSEFAAEVSDEQSEVTPSSEDATVVIERKVIKEGEIRFETSSVEETKLFISQAVQELNGYISKEDVNYYKSVIEHRLVIRIPSSYFDQFLDEITRDVIKIDSKTINVIDVTEEYIDINARLETKKEIEIRYKELLKQAVKVEEILAIEKEIGTLREEIEAVEGRLNYLTDRIDLSIITVSYYQKSKPSFDFISKLEDALTNGWKGLLWFLIGLTHIWPFILIFALGVFLLIRIKRKRESTKTQS